MTDEKIKFHLKKVGFKKGNLVDFWYSDPGVIRGKLDQIVPTLGQEIEKIIRWKTDFGKRVIEIVKSFIKIKLDEAKEKNTENFNNGKYLISIAIIDFNEVLIDEMSINNFMYSKINHFYSTSGWNDLSGIPLENIRIENAIIKNALFSFGSFNNSTLQGVRFENCNLSSCTFDNCHLSNLKMDENGSLSNCSWADSNLNVIKISSKNFGVNPIYKRISYFDLIRVAVTGKVGNRKNRGYTDFSSCEIIYDDSSFQFKKHGDYINWYQSTIYDYSEINMTDDFLLKNFKRVKNLFNAATTKNWESPLVTISSGFFLIFIFSLIYYFARDYFVEVDSYGKALNLSIHVFTTLGLSNMLPNFKKGEIGLWLISIECICGYIWLALAMMVLARKIFK